MTAYRTVDADGVEVFYREAGDPGAPTLLLLHGFPTSSTQYHELIDRLSIQEVVHLDLLVPRGLLLGLAVLWKSSNEWLGGDHTAVIPDLVIIIV